MQGLLLVMASVGSGIVLTGAIAVAAGASESEQVLWPVAAETGAGPDENAIAVGGDPDRDADRLARFAPMHGERNSR